MEEKRWRRGGRGEGGGLEGGGGEDMEVLECGGEEVCE